MTFVTAIGYDKTPGASARAKASRYGSEVSPSESNAISVSAAHVRADAIAETLAFVLLGQEIQSNAPIGIRLRKAVAHRMVMRGDGTPGRLQEAVFSRRSNLTGVNQLKRSVLNRRHQLKSERP